MKGATRDTGSDLLEFRTCGAPKKEAPEKTLGSPSFVWLGTNLACFRASSPTNPERRDQHPHHRTTVPPTGASGDAQLFSKGPTGVLLELGRFGMDGRGDGRAATRQSTRSNFTTDGRSFYFTVGSRESDVWTVRLSRE